ncbi:MAG TPA: winged helix-turn-helix domain-containing protein [Pyrinomonadaceae bacterium]|jgi:DNA-binding winged helix-turn-helix (wHTH) protein/TolB-like protein/Tfp pilus assembly protein PilF|nr:winged helix-turn-helix domain-containing protein [Pyrinomonadaceae bacterium]
MEDTGRRIYEFGPFRLDVTERRLRRGPEVKPLADKSFEVLVALLERRGSLISKDELMERVWPDAVVEENQLASNISLLRKALGDDAKAQRYIQTVPKHGYRFRAEGETVSDEGDTEIVVAERIRSHIILEEKSEPAREAGAGPVAAEDALPPGAALPARRRRRLGRLAAAAGAFLAVALAVAGWYAFKGRAARAPLPRSIAVLPLKPLVASNTDPALELGITDALITKLANLRQIAVRPTNSVLKYTGEGHDLYKVGEELGVDVLLDGRVQKAGERIRLSVQLVRAADGAPIWADTFEARFTDIFEVQDRISREVVSKLALQLTGEERRGLAKRYTENPEAYQLYLKGLYHWRTFTHDGLLNSLNFYNAAIEKDPRYALAYSGLANAYTVIGIYGPLPAAESMEKARQAARRAVELDDSLPEGHAAIGGNKIFYEWDWPGAERELKRAKELEGPEGVNGKNLYGYYLWALGRTDEAVEELRKAAEMAPQWRVPARDYIESLYLARRYDEAIDRCTEALRLEPDEPFVHWILGRSRMMQGRHEEALAQFERGLGAAEKNGPVSATQVWLLSGLGYAHARAGRRDEALKILARMRENQSRPKTFYVALVWAGLGERDRAFALLDEAYRERYPFLWQIRVLPEFDPLRSDPRYADLLRRMNLTP